MEKMKLVMIGNGMAGARTLEELLKLAPDLYEIEVFGAEPYANYNRILLSQVLSGEQSIGGIMLNDVEWYAGKGITLHLNRQVSAINRARRTVQTSDGKTAGYDRLIIATGSTPIVLPVPGSDLEGVVAFRSIRDVDTMLEASVKFKSAVVIGGGLLGLEAASGLLSRGMDVTVVHLAEWLMERQLDRAAAGLLQESLEAKGLKFLLGKQTVELLPAEIPPSPPLHPQGVRRGVPDASGITLSQSKGGAITVAGATISSLKKRGAIAVADATIPPLKKGGTRGDLRVGAIRFKDGETLPADLVVMAAGIRPSAALAEAAGIHCNRGIVVNDTMQTYDPRIYAVGECVSHRGVSYGLVAPLFEQAKVCANHLAQIGISRYSGSATSTKLKVTGIDLFSCGDFTGGKGAEEIVLSDPSAGVYKKLVVKEDKIVGSVLYGDTADGSWYFQLLRDGQNIRELRDRLMSGQSHLGSSGHQGRNNASSMPDDMEVCGCNGVCKGTIVKAIKEKGLFTLNDVRKHTKASASCGSCTGLVEQILASTVGGAYQPADVSRKPLCGCTDYTHEEIRKAIIERKLKSIPEAMGFFEWRNVNGCASCRPALNYYLLCAWPHDYRDDPQSRFINERAHANIQKDGTYSVIPRIHGGVTTPAQLRRIADVAEKYAIREVRCTGGQRINMLGVKKEDLPKVWSDLDMPSGFAYGKSIRTVKTCVGSEWCRFGVQDSTSLGIALEQSLDRMWAPHKVKLAVSGCPRNCAEATIKDVGIVGVESGWEIYVAGNGGIKAEVSQFLVKVKSAEEVMEYAGAFIQLYREEARYLDRTVHWVQRAGMDYVKARIVEDAAGRRALHERLTDALRDEKDPWQERVRGMEAREFVPIRLQS
ncbi:MAG: nitrite reductase (NAD(P)H) large subunit [Gallionellaceae bacterium]|nr:MAG: nitrite reductase (NAD(P)H) large subunit [Gallionellaceae bacterium]